VSINSPSTSGAIIETLEGHRPIYDDTPGFYARANERVNDVLKRAFVSGIVVGEQARLERAQ